MAGCRFRLELYPNGHTERAESKGHVSVFLRLMSSPDGAAVIVDYSITLGTPCLMRLSDACEWSLCGLRRRCSTTYSAVAVQSTCKAVPPSRPQTGESSYRTGGTAGESLLRLSLVRRLLWPVMLWLPSLSLLYNAGTTQRPVHKAVERLARKIPNIGNWHALVNAHVASAGTR